MTTFADGADPPVMQAIKEAKIPYAEFFRFNNSALYARSTDSEFSKMFWEMGHSSFSKFFQYLLNAKPVSLQMTQTRQVLEERQHLETIVHGIQPQINQGLEEIDELRQEEEVLKKKDSEVLANKDFTYQVKVTKQRQTFTPQGQFVTNCVNCNYTCHEVCAIEDDREKWKCAAMASPHNESSSVCSVCPGKCTWRKHYNNGYVFELYEEMETRTSADLYRRYNRAKSAKANVEDIITKMEDDLKNLYLGVFHYVCEARKCLQRLDEIALTPNPLTEVEYIDLLIESEKQQKQVGFINRIEYMNRVREEAVLLSRMKNQFEIDVATASYEKCSKTMWQRFTGWFIR